MSATTKVAASPSANVASAPSRIAAGGRFTSTEKIDGAAGSSSVGVSGGWRSTYEGETGQGGLGQNPQQHSADQNQFTPLIARSAAAFGASENNSDPRLIPSLFLTDLQHGVGVYEFNMKVIAGTFKTQGHVVNRYS
ncbi:MAG TPA: hypothetical protein HPP80_03345 [Rhodospirillaceae bacterium]|nr:hypothetical protein [Rhodospirillaceae bacterium]